MKFSNIFIISISFVFFLSCKKKEQNLQLLPMDYDYSHYQGNYYGVRTNDAQSFLSESESDCILSTTVSVNQISFFNETFNLAEPQITSFNWEELYSGYAHLNFSSDFNQITMNRKYDGGITKVIATFAGEKTLLPVSNGQEHPLKSQLEGIFRLNISKQEHINGVNEDYADTVFVTMNGYSPVIENEEYSFGSHHSYSKNKINLNGIIREYDLFWVEDSIYINYNVITTQYAGPVDTVHHVYSGVRL